MKLHNLGARIEHEEAWWDKAVCVTCRDEIVSIDEAAVLTAVTEKTAEHYTEKHGGRGNFALPEDHDELLFAAWRNDAHVKLSWSGNAAHEYEIRAMTFRDGGQLQWVEITSPTDKSCISRMVGSATLSFAVQTIVIEHIDGKVEYRRAPEEVEAALRRRFDSPDGIAAYSDKPNVWLFDVRNWWDGANQVTDNRDGTFTFRNPYTQQEDTFS